MNIEQEIMDRMERSDMCWPRSHMTAEEVLTAIGGDAASYEQLMRVARFMPNFCKSEVRFGLKRYECRLKLTEVGGGAVDVTNT